MTSKGVIKGRKWPPSVFWLFFFSSPFHFFSTLLQWWGDLKTRGCGLHCVMLACLSSKRKDRRNPWLTRLTIFSALTESSVLKDCGLILYLWLNENLMWIMETRYLLPMERSFYFCSNTKKAWNNSIKMLIITRSNLIMVDHGYSLRSTMVTYSQFPKLMELDNELHCPRN